MSPGPVLLVSFHFGNILVFLVPGLIPKFLVGIPCHRDAGMA